MGVRFARQNGTRKFCVVLCFLLLTTGCRKEADKPNAIPPDRHDLSASTTDVQHRSRRPAGLLPLFRSVGRDAGLDFKRYDDMSRQRRILEVIGGGVGMFDFDQDGWLDIFFTNGCCLPLRLDDRDSPAQLFRNVGDMRFERVTQPSLLLQFGFAHGCSVGDFDSDGFDDLYVAAFGRNSLWHGNGDGTFTDITQVTGTQAPQWSSSAAFADINGDSHLDLYVANYLAESDESPRLCPNPASPDGFEGCSPALFEGVEDVLFLSDGQGQFIDATESTGIAGLRGKGLGVVVSDLDRDGHSEIFVANDGQANYLFVPSGPRSDNHAPTPSSETTDNLLQKHEAGLGFTDRALASNVAFNEVGYAQAGMGIAAGDYDANGTMDLFLTHFFGDTNTLYSNRGELMFEDATRSANLSASSRRMLGFGTTFIDVDNSGWLDLFVANGHIDDLTWTSQNVPYRMRPQLYHNQRDGRFVQVSEWSGEYFSNDWLGRGVASGDLDRDGREDLVVSHQLAASLALHNETKTEFESAHVRLIGTVSNRNAFGVRVQLLDGETTMLREIVGGGSFQSASALEMHIGLGAREHAEIRVHWPSGIQEHHVVSAGKCVITEARGIRNLIH